MAAPPPVLTLAVEKGPRAGETRVCRAGAALRVGRVVSGNDLAVRDVGASQRHLAIEFLPPPEARWAVSDIGSSNGTFLNGSRLDPSVPAPLSHGDLIVLGESTKLAVSIAPDSEVKPAPRRSSRRAAPTAKVVDEKPTPSVIRRSTRKKAGAAAEPYEAEKEGPDAAAVVVAVEEENPQMVTRRSSRNKAAAVESQEAGKEQVKEAPEETRRGRKKKAVEPPEPEKVEEQKEEKAVVVTRRTRRKNAEPSEPEKGEEGNDALTVALPPLPPKTRSRRVRGRFAPACAMETVHEEEEKEVVAAPREEKDDKVAAGDGELEGTTKALEEVPVAPRGRRTRRAPKGMTNAQCAASENAGKELKVGGEEEEDGKRGVMVSGGTVGNVENAEDHAEKSSMETMPVAPREQARRAPKRMTNAQCAASDNRGEEIKGGGEEEGDDKRGSIASGGKVGDMENAQEHAEESSLETMSVAPREQARGAPKGMTNAQCAASDNRGEEKMGGGEEEEDGKMEAVGNGGDVEDVQKTEKHAGRSSLETMTLGEWFDRMEKYLPRMINEAADEMIATMEEQHRRINEYISTLESSSNPS